MHRHPGECHKINPLNKLYTEVKMRKKILPVLTAGFLLSGCFASLMTETALITDGIRTLQNAKSVDLSMEIEAETKIDALSVPGLKLTYDLQYTKEPMVICGKLSSEDLSGLGTLYTYTEKQNGGYVIYTNYGGFWMKTEAESVETEQNIPIWQIMGAVMKYKDRLSLNEEAGFEGKEVYEISGTLAREDITELLRPYISRISGASENLTLPDTPVSIYFDKETRQPAGAYFEVNNAEVTVMEMQASLGMKVKIVCNGFNTIDEIVIPEEARHAQ